MRGSDGFVSVVVPLSDDGEVVEAFVAELVDTLRSHYAHYEIVLVDDGSRDDTVARVSGLLGRHEGLRLIRLTRRFGTEVAIASGLDGVIGDVVVVMLPDSASTRLIPDMVREVQRGQDVVFGVRGSRDGEPLWLRIGARVFYWVCGKMLGLEFPRDATEFQVLSRRAVNAILQIKDRYRYLRVLSAYVGYAHKTFAYEPVSRSGRRRRLGLLAAISLAIGIIVTNSIRPLRFVSWLTASGSALSALCFGYAAAGRLLGFWAPEGLSTLVLLASGAFSLALLALAVMSEYLGRVLDESRGRPLYHILEERTSSVLLTDDEGRNVVTESGAVSPGVRVGSGG